MGSPSDDRGSSLNRASRVTGDAAKWCWTKGRRYCGITGSRMYEAFLPEW